MTEQEKIINEYIVNNPIRHIEHIKAGFTNLVAKMAKIYYTDHVEQGLLYAFKSSIFAYMKGLNEHTNRHHIDIYTIFYLYPRLTEVVTEKDIEIYNKVCNGYNVSVKYISIDTINNIFNKINGKA